MNRIKLSSFVLAMLAAGSAMASPLSPSQALQRALSSEGPCRISTKLNAEPVYSVVDDAMTPTLYVFANSDGNGYQIISGSDIAFPVLGYSDNGKFDTADLNPELKWWIEEYSRQIEWAEKNNIKYNSANGANAQWPAISPLCKSKWNQDAPYWNQCPVASGQSNPCPTGCVATSMAQVMYYHKYPEVGTGFINYVARDLNKTMVMNLAKFPFDWDNMLDIYEAGNYDETQADAVALLMKACGYSVEMNYGIEGSGASGVMIGSALRKYFNYDEGCHSEFRAVYSMSEWSQKIYDNIKNIGPVIINGRDFDGSMGHSFVCDGYDGNGYFHFNWGWGGVSDGYFSLNALNPDAMGIGGYGGGFNTGQNAIFGIQPNTGQSYTSVETVLQYGNMTGQISAGKLIAGASGSSPAGWSNPSDYAITGSFGFKFESVAANSEPTYVSALFNNASRIGLVAGGAVYTTNNYSINANLPTELPDGKYKVTLMFSTKAGQWNESLVTYGNNNFIYLTKTGSNFVVEEVPAEMFTVTSAEVDSKLYYGKKTQFKVTYKNDTDLELSQGVLPRLYKDGVLCMQGSGVLVSVEPHDLSTQEFVSRFSAINNYKFTTTTEFDFVLYNPTNNVEYGNFGKVTMEKAPDALALQSKSFEIANSEMYNMEYANSSKKAYNVMNPSDFDVDMTYSVRIGYFDGTIKLAIYEVDPQNINRLNVIVDQIFAEEPFMSSGETSTINVKVNFPQAEQGVLYAIRSLYSSGSSWKTLGTIYFAKDILSGVEDLIDESTDDTLEYYNLQGVKVLNPVKGQLLIRKSGSKIENIVF